MISGMYMGEIVRQVRMTGNQDRKYTGNKDRKSGKEKDRKQGQAIRTGNKYR